MDSWELLTDFWKMQRAIRSKVTPELEKLGITAFDPLLLAKLEVHKYPSEVAKHTQIPAATISQVLKRLEKDGFVVRQLDAQDFRKHCFQLTEKGEEALKASQNCFLQALQNSLNLLSDSEKQTFADLLHKITEGEE